MNFEFKSKFAKNILINKQHEFLFADKQSQQIDDEITKIKEEYNQLCKESNDLTSNFISKKSTMMIDNEVQSLRNQLKQVDSSRQMYRICLEKVLLFFEQLHHNLESLSDKSNENFKRYNKYQIPESNYNTFQDFTIRKSNQTQFLSNETPPDKLSKEALSFIRVIRLTLETTEYVKDSDQYFKQNEFLQAIKQEFCQDKRPLKSSDNKYDMEFNNISPIQHPKHFNRSKLSNSFKLSNFNHSNYIDNESGFSSMNSSHEKHTVSKDILSKITTSSNSQQNYDEECWV